MDTRQIYAQMPAHRFAELLLAGVKEAVEYAYRSRISQCLWEMRLELMAARRGFIYFAKGVEHIKIGFSANPLKRVGQLATEYPTQTGGERPTLLATMPALACDESRLHFNFRGYRVDGEWFLDCPAIRQYIAAFAQEVA